MGIFFCGSILFEKAAIVVIEPAPLLSHLRLLSVCKIRMEVSVRRMSDPSLGKRRSSNPLVGLDGSAAQQLMIPLGEGSSPQVVPSAGLNSKTDV